MRLASAPPETGIIIASHHRPLIPRTDSAVEGRKQTLERTREFCVYFCPLSFFLFVLLYVCMRARVCGYTTHSLMVVKKTRHYIRIFYAE